MSALNSDNIRVFLRNGGLTFFCCLLTVIILPAYVHYLPPVMILWGLVWFLENTPGIRKVFITDNKAAVLFYMFICFFLWQMAGLFFTDSLNSGFERIFKRLSLLLFPLVLFYPGKKIILNIRLILRIFAVCTFLYVLFCFANALHNSLTLSAGKWIFNPRPVDYDYENYFHAERLSYLVHPSYLAMYIVISVLISLESFFDSSVKLLRKGFWMIIILIFFAGLYLISSRAGILALIVTLPLYFLFKFYNKFSKWILLAVVAIIGVIIVEIARTNEKVQTSIEGISSTNFDTTLKNDERLLIWKSAVGVIRGNIVLGVGTGDASEELKKEFKKRGYVNGFYDNLNAHNQFLEIMLENGLIGLVIFLTVIGYMSYLAIFQKNLISGLFIIMMIIFFMFETVLNRLAGITFFPLFTFLLINLKRTAGD
jgi:O-antigen ligase